MSRINATRKRGTQALGKRRLPDDIDTRQCDHPIVRAIGFPSLRLMERDAGANCEAYLRSVVNPSLPQMERFVVQSLKVTHLDETVQRVRWGSELPPSVQRVINRYWQTRTYARIGLVGGSAVAVGL